MMQKMMEGNGTSKRFSNLASRELRTVQIAHLRTQFELAERSVLAEAGVDLTDNHLKQWEEENDILRVRPGEMVVEDDGNRIVLPILDAYWMSRLDVELHLHEVRRHHEHQQFEQFRAVDLQATYGDLHQSLGRRELNCRRTPKDYDFLPPEPFGEAEAAALRKREDSAMVPKSVMESVVQTLVAEHGCRPGQAKAMVRAIASLYVWCCPRLDELSPGQLVWLTYGTKKSRKTDPRLFVPVILTVLTSDEFHQSFQHGGERQAFRIRQLHRITTEAWKQDGVLTTTDVEWITGIHAAAARGLLEAYQAKFGIILPTAGTILDMGRTLTHKKVVVELSLQGLTTQQIARRLYHTPEAVHTTCECSIDCCCSTIMDCLRR